MLVLSSGCRHGQGQLRRDLEQGTPYAQLDVLNRIIQGEVAGLPLRDAVAGCILSADARVSVCAARALGGMGDASLPFLTPLLAHEDPEVRWKAAMGLAVSGGAAKGAVPALMEALQDKTALVRQYAAMALGTTGDVRAVEALKPCLQDPDAHVKQAADRAIRRLSGL